MSKAKSMGIGIVGMGFMGTTHLMAARTLKGARVVAIVTQDPRKARGDFRGVRGNFGAGAGRVDLTGIAVHPTPEDLLADDRVDLVDLCLPSHLHPRAAIRCLKAGKHVLVEKPIAVIPRDAQRMLAAARASGKLLMVAQVLKFFPEFALLSEAVKTGRWGRLLALHLRRNIAMPSWGTESWFSDPKRSGGMVIDLHIHDTDFALYLFGKPRAVTTHGIASGRRIDFLRTTYHFKTGSPFVTAEGGWINAPGLGFKHGYDAFFERGTIHFDSSRGPRPVLHEADGPVELKLPAVDGFRAELEAAVEGVRRGKVPPGLSAVAAALSLETCKAEEKSLRTGKTVKLC